MSVAQFVIAALLNLLTATIPELALGLVLAAIPLFYVSIIIIIFAFHPITFDIDSPAGTAAVSQNFTVEDRTKFIARMKTIGYNEMVEEWARETFDTAAVVERKGRLINKSLYPLVTGLVLVGSAVFILVLRTLRFF